MENPDSARDHAALGERVRHINLFGREVAVCALGLVRGCFTDAGPEELAVILEAIAVEIAHEASLLRSR